MAADLETTVTRAVVVVVPQDTPVEHSSVNAPAALALAELWAVIRVEDLETVSPGGRQHQQDGCSLF